MSYAAPGLFLCGSISSCRDFIAIESTVLCRKIEKTLNRGLLGAAFFALMQHGPAVPANGSQTCPAGPPIWLFGSCKNRKH